MSTYDLQPKKYNLTIGWLYPELMSTYGDRGNITVLQKIAENNDIEVEILRINQSSNSNLLSSCDLIFMGGAQDLQQEIVNKDLISSKGNVLKQLIENGIPGLYICGAYQFLGNYYKDAYGTKIQGLGIFDMYTESYKTKHRLIGNVVVKPMSTTNNLIPKTYLVGFENHGGRTYLENPEQAFAKVVHGFGNNGEDKSEGIVFKNTIGTYMHGPILPCNPSLATSLLSKALEKKYGKKFDIQFEDSLAEKAKEVILKRMNISHLSV